MRFAMIYILIGMGAGAFVADEYPDRRGFQFFSVIVWPIPASYGAFKAIDKYIDDSPKKNDLSP